MADEDGDDLQQHDDVDDAVAGAKAWMRLAEPRAKHAVFGNTVEHAVGTDDGGVDRAGQNDGADDYHEAVKDQSYDQRALKTHGQPADKIFQKALTHVVRNDHHREKRDQRSKHQAVNKNNRTGLFQVGQLGVFDIAINLGERLFAAHGQHGMAERDEYRNDAEHVRKATVGQPAQRTGTKPEISRMRPWRKRRVT